ncbi:MAG: peptidase M24 [Acidiferrobacteraceae bacterium]|jgi:Xaa-Pro aminopeptidase|nr:peptidase M24 [Acidiferrobacteraceae bacterium]MDP6949623.1 Xaa-Pro peptidase family protein [Arenicellales bacterium]|tara:strand:+ start:6006 stop:7172 length:1167 start_codon:yes stop_codon:yes gene_type:complete
MNTMVQRGFETAEFEQRTHQIQRVMRDARFDAIVVTTEAEIRYFSGFHTQFFESPTRPWFLVVPAAGKPIAVIPQIGQGGMAGTWIDDIHTWPSPRPADDGISLLKKVITALPTRFGRLGMPMGPESILRMPAGDAKRLMQNIPLETADCAELLLRQRFIKSPAEIEKIRQVCQITSGAFEALPDHTQLGDSEIEITRRLRIDLLERGADNTPFMVAGSGAGGYDSIIMGPTQRTPQDGDVLIIDTGTVFDGYFCDFDRNFGFGHVADDTRRANTAVHQAVDAGFAAARPGVRMREVWAAMWQVLEDYGALGNSIGRMGHGLGMLLTEWPSVHPEDENTLEAGVVMTLEPGMTFAPGRQLVHEENIVITQDGAEYLTRRAPPDIPLIQ